MLQELLQPVLGTLLNGVIERIFPDKAKQEMAKLEVTKALAEIDFKKMELDSKEMQGQMVVNAEEAKSLNMFIAGWRPAAGWVCVAGLIYQTVGANLLNVGLIAAGYPPLAPIDTSTLMTLLFGMLGLGYYRTKEKLSK